MESNNLAAASHSAAAPINWRPTVETLWNFFVACMAVFVICACIVIARAPSLCLILGVGMFATIVTLYVAEGNEG